MAAPPLARICNPCPCNCRYTCRIIKHFPRTLVVLDEILLGTNTKDKQTCSLGLLEKLISLNAVVLVATHDLTLGELETNYPDIVTNNCFEVELTND